MSLLDSSMICPPIESLTQVSRNCQKLISKDVTSLMSHLTSLTSAMPKNPNGNGNGGGASTATPPCTTDKLTIKQKVQITKSLQAMMKEAQALKKKLCDSAKVSSKQAGLCTSRLYYLREVDELSRVSQNDPMDDIEMMDEPAITTADDEMETKTSHSAVTPSPSIVRNSQDMDIDSSPPATALESSSHPASMKRPLDSNDPEDRPNNFRVDTQLRVARMFADQLLRSDRPATANLLISSTPGLSSLVDSSIFLSGRKIELSLRADHDCSKALIWCGENRSRITKIRSTFEFDLRLQEFLTFVQNKKPIQAIEYARKYLAPAAITTIPATSAAATNGNGNGNAAPSPAPAPPLDRTISLPGPSPPVSSVGVIRNASVGPPSSAAEPSETVSGESAATLMVADSERVKILQEAMNLLVFDAFDDSICVADSASGCVPPAWHKYRVYFSPGRFDDLADEFHRTHLAIHGLHERSTMEQVLNIGLGCIKTNTCKCDTHTHQEREEEKGNETRTAAADESMEEQKESSAPDVTSSPLRSPSPPFPSACPSCLPPFSCLSHSLPVGARSHSRLVCRISGDLMDDKNPPMVLPNGYVYSRKALTEMAKRKGGIVTCTQTKQEFLFTQAKIAYVL